MKNFIFGIIFGVFSVYITNDIHSTLYYFDFIDKRPPLIFNPNLGISSPIIGNCTKDVSKNGHGWIFISREYFKCNKLQIMISDYLYGEYTRPRNLELEKKACKDCSI